MLDKTEILSIISNELSLSRDNSGNNEASLSMYLGNPDGKEVEGRSHIVSTDVADAIEWIMPQVMKSFTQNNEVVVFDPVHEGDEYQAELESEYVYEVLMKQNDGFIILHQFVKDALMQRNGILKCYYAERTFNKVSDWTGITEEQLQMLVGAEGVEIIEISDHIDEHRTVQKQQEIEQQLNVIKEQIAANAEKLQDPRFQLMMDQDPTIKEGIDQLEDFVGQLMQEMEVPVMAYNVKINSVRVKGQIYIDPVPPEEFRYNSKHNSINLSNARFTAHQTIKTVSEAIDEYDLTKEDTDELPEETSSYDREYRFNLQDSETFSGSESEDDSQRELAISECFMKMDIDETGIAKKFKITVAGDDEPSDILLIEEVDSYPWISTTTFLMSHKFEGLSIADRLKQIQEQKTAIWRNMLDNMYLQNNQRNVVLEGQVNMDDLLVSRPGGIIRAKRLDAVMPLATPQLGQDAYNMMEYLDRVRAGRTGVDPDGNATPQNIGDRVGSEGVDRLMNAKEELVGLIVRVIAETGIKPLCVKIRDLSIQHIDAVIDFRFRGVWQQVNPSTWCDRTNTTVRVGTGTGDHNRQVAALSQILALQEKVAADPRSAVLLDTQRTFNTIDDFCKFSGLNGATRYFIDPTSPEGQKKAEEFAMSQKSASEKEEMMQTEMVNIQKQLANAESGKVQAQQEATRAKTQIEGIKNQLQFEKQNSESQIKALEAQIKEAKLIIDKLSDEEKDDLERYRIDSNVALELTRIEADKGKEQNKNFKENKGDVNAA